MREDVFKVIFSLLEYLLLLFLIFKKGLLLQNISIETHLHL
jgi:hypothetical protein